uniref:Collagen type IV alpha-3-binding protein n=1 Tax=Cacopsylla melanoneura TaxID=428564 RepID=A0A8D8V5B8_9HEMI
MTDYQVNPTSVTQPLNDSEDHTDKSRVPILQGYLSKWTNYIHGWQNRWIVLTNGTLSYYKSETETAHGCRGAISLNRATIKAHELDLCRFDISVNDCTWCLRAETEEDKHNWVDVLEGFKVESGYGSENNLNNSRQEKQYTIQSEVHTEPSPEDTEIFQLGKADDVSLDETRRGSFNFRTESLLFKDTTREVLDSLTSVVSLIQRGEDMWGKRLSHETEKRKKTMEGAAYSSLMKQSNRDRDVS